MKCPTSTGVHARPTMYQEGVPRGAIKKFSPEYEVPYSTGVHARPTMYQEGVPRGAIKNFLTRHCRTMTTLPDNYDNDGQLRQ